MQLNLFVFFFFQAEDGIRDSSVTGVQTCALPIFEERLVDRDVLVGGKALARDDFHHPVHQQKWIAVWQQRLDLLLIHHPCCLLNRSISFRNSRTSFISEANCENAAEFLSQFRCSIAGLPETIAPSSRS